jgi:DNA-binding transcriptional regulator PaaX
LVDYSLQLEMQRQKTQQARRAVWISMGMDSLGRILVVVYTWRVERVRLISARPATRRAARQYEKGIFQQRHRFLQGFLLVMPERTERLVDQRLVIAASRFVHLLRRMIRDAIRRTG